MAGVMSPVTVGADLSSTQFSRVQLEGTHRIEHAHNMHCTRLHNIQDIQHDITDTNYTTAGQYKGCKI